MNILLIFPLCPLPAQSGGQVRVWNIAKQLSRRHSIDLVCFIRDESEKKYEPELLTVFRSVAFIQRKKLFDRSALLGGISSFISFVLANIGLLFSALLSNRSLLSHLYSSSTLYDQIKEVDSVKKYDLIYAETFYGIASLKNLLPELKTKLLLIEQNIESLAYYRQSQQQKNIVIRWLMMLDVHKIRMEEEYFWKSAAVLGALSDVDQKYLKDKTGKDVVLLENGVDIEWFSQPRSERLENEVLFVGTFSYFQNVDSLRWFLDEIWPKVVSASTQELSLRIVGRRGDETLKKYVAAKNLRIDESVEDIRDAFQRATVLVAPIRAGSGTKYKVIEAMASHLPVVTTTVGAEGLTVTSGKELFIADSVEVFVTCVLNVLKDREVRQTIANNAYDFVTERYDWQQIVSRFDETVLLH